MAGPFECPKCWNPLEQMGDLLWCTHCKEEFIQEGQFIVPYLVVPTELEYAES